MVPPIASPASSYPVTLSVKVAGVAIGSLDDGESEAVRPETTGKKVTARFVV
jgi:hypothetical protein